jgi:hypothetical protein
VNKSLNALSLAERQYHALALIEAMVQVLTQAGPAVSCHYVSSAPRDGFFEAEGVIDLIHEPADAVRSPKGYRACFSAESHCKSDNISGFGYQ